MSRTKTYYFPDISLENALGQSAHFYVVDYYSSSSDVLDLLIEAGADVSMKDVYGYNILHWAAYMCQYDMAKYLIDDLGMDTEVKTYYDETALDIANNVGCKDYVDSWKTFKKLLG